MNQSLSALLGGAKRALKSDIVPELTSDYARAQAFALVDILEKLEKTVAWSTAPIHEELALLSDACSELERCAAEMDDSLPSWSPAATCKDEDDALDAELTAANARLIAITDWLYAPRGCLPGASRALLDALLRKSLIRVLDLQRRVITRADYSAMSGASGG
jgi:hypothetical protein